MSAKTPLPPPDEPIVNITLVLRPHGALPELHQEVATVSPHPRHLTHAQLATHHSAHPGDIAIVHSFAHNHHLHLAGIDAARRTVQLSGSRADIDAAFQTSTRHRSDAQPASIPDALEDIVESVLGLHHAPAAHRHKTPFHCPDHKPRPLRDLATAYDFPPGTDGHRQTIGLIELGGGFHRDDIDLFCKQNGLPTPTITAIEVHGGLNQPAAAHAIHEMLDCVDGQLKLSAAAQQSSAIESAQATVEVTMDIEILAALAPAAHIVVYFATPDEQGIYHALSQAIHDHAHPIDVLSISWGEPEIALSEHYLRAIDLLLLTACHLGITVCASSGDSGAINNSPDNLPAVNFPASSPHCLACGGTTSHFSDETGTLQVAHEIVWNASHFGIKGATGGGVSRRFAMPPWQHTAAVPLGPTGHPGRGVPDVAGPADPRSGFEIHIAGRTCSSAGTSAVAPLWAALIACCNQALGQRCGYLNPHIYHIGHHRLDALRPVTEGNNDGYQAGPGWNPCVGYGTPAGTHLLHHLHQSLPPKRR